MNLLRRTIAPTLAALLFTGTMTFGVSAKSGDITTHIGTVDATSLRLRANPSTSSKILDTAYDGEYVIITGKTGSWYKVSYDLTEGYMHTSYLDAHTAKNVELGYGSVTGNKVNVRSGPGTDYRSIRTANTGARVYIIGFNKKWYKVICGEDIGYIRSDYVRLTEVPYENRSSSRDPLFFIDGKSTGLTPSASALKSGNSSGRSAVVAHAKQLLGIPYVWGGTTPKGFDCSGLTQYVYAQSGISLPRTTTEQVQQGTYVPKSELQPGDLVFLQNTYRSGVSHVGIYIGDGKVIHASSSKGVTASSLSGSYFAKHYHSARRIL